MYIQNIHQGPCKCRHILFNSISLLQNNDIGRMRRYSRNILQWKENDIKSTRITTGDFSPLTKTRLGNTSLQHRQSKMIVTYEIFRPVIPAFGTWAVISSGSTESPVWTARIFADRITFGWFSIRKCKFRTASTICPGSTLEEGSHCNQIKYSLIYRPFCCK